MGSEGIWDDLVLGTGIIAVTVLIHSTAIDAIAAGQSRAWPHFSRLRARHHYVIYMTISVLLLFLAHTVQIWLWALVFYGLDALPNFSDALYFSTVTYTTLGYGDVVLGTKWRLLGGFEAANGLLLIGWSTAFLFAIMNRIWDDRNRHRPYRSSSDEAHVNQK